MRKLLVSVLAFFLLYKPGHSQVNRAPFKTEYKQQRNQILAYNLLLNGFIGGIGGALNKKKDEKLLHAFGKNFLKGTLGGTFKYAAKKATFHKTSYGDNRWIGATNRVLYFTGHSFVNNAALNRRLLKHFNFQIFGIDLNLDLREKPKLKARYSATTLYSLGRMAMEGHHFNLKESLKYGNFCFDWNDKREYEHYGYALHNVFVLKGFREWVAIHEMNHTYQFYDFMPLSYLYHKPLKKVREDKRVKTFNKYFYLDFPFFLPIYGIQPKPVHYKNFFELEAQHFAIQQYIRR